MLTCMVITGALFTLDQAKRDTHTSNAIVAFICIYVIGFSWSWGPLAWLIPSEINPIETRAAGVGIAAFTNFLTAFLVSQTALPNLCSSAWIGVPSSCSLCFSFV